MLVSSIPLSPESEAGLFWNILEAAILCSFHQWRGVADKYFCYCNEDYEHFFPLSVVSWIVLGFHFVLSISVSIFPITGHLTSFFGWILITLNYPIEAFFLWSLLLVPHLLILSLVRFYLLNSPNYHFSMLISFTTSLLLLLSMSLLHTPI